MKENTKKEVTNVAEKSMNITVVDGLEVFDDIEVLREPYESKNRSGKKVVYNSYMIKSKLRGRDIQVNFVSGDAGGYNTLDIVYNGKNSAKLGRMINEMTDVNGKVNKFSTYYIVDIDETGMVYKMPVKLKARSDTANLEMIIMSKLLSNEMVG